MQLLNVISSLDSKTIQRAKLFFDSPYLNKNKRATVAFNILCKNIKADMTVLKGLIWSKIYNEKPYDDAVFRKLMHDILDKLFLFFSIEEIQSSKPNILRFLSKYSQLNGLNLLKNKLQRKLDYAKSSEIIDTEAYYDLYSSQRNIIRLEDDFTRKRKYKKVDEFLSELNQLNSLLDTSYAIEKIRLLLLQRNFNLLTGESINNISDAILDDIFDKHKMDNSLISKVYQMKYHLLVKENDEVVIDDIIEKLRIISKGNIEEASELFDNLSNYIVYKLNQGEDFFKEQYSLFVFGVESKILLRNNLIDPTDYRNIVITACRLSEFEWALDFVDKYKQFIEEKYRQSAYSFSKARIFWYAKNYAKVIETLRNVEYEDITYNLNSKLMLITSLYELQEFDVLESTIKAFKVFLRRRRNMPKKRKENFVLFCDTLYNILRADEKRDVKRLQKAEHILRSNPGLLSRWWLEEKLIEIKGNLGIKEEVQSTPT